jgi:hypothetical protein
LGSGNRYFIDSIDTYQYQKLGISAKPAFFYKCSEYIIRMRLHRGPCTQSIELWRAVNVFIVFYRFSRLSHAPVLECFPNRPNPTLSQATKQGLSGRSRCPWSPMNSDLSLHQCQCSQSSLIISWRCVSLPLSLLHHWHQLLSQLLSTTRRALGQCCHSTRNLPFAPRFGGGGRMGYPKGEYFWARLKKPEHT